eukprot:gene3549-3996_t
MVKLEVRTHQFMAHSGAVQCVRLGRKSKQMLATGGKDNKINVWKTTSHHAIASLPGHNTGATCLCFSSKETNLISGSEGGGVKFWDLNTGSVACTHNNGHKAAVTCLDTHPIKNFYASGSRDAMIKPQPAIAVRRQPAAECPPT